MVVVDKNRETGLQKEVEGPPLTDTEYEDISREHKRLMESHFSKWQIASEFHMRVEEATDAEYETYRTFAGWALDRILIAAMRAPVFGCGTKRDRVRCAMQNIGRLSFHEVQHALVAVMDDPTQPVPDFIWQRNQTRDEKLVRDEMHAFYFWRDGGLPVVFLALTKPEPAEHWAMALESVYQKSKNKERRDRMTKVVSKIRALTTEDRKDFEKCFALGNEVLLVYLEGVVEREIRVESTDTEAGGAVDDIRRLAEKMKFGAHYEKSRASILKKPSPQFKEMAKRMFTTYVGGSNRGVFNEALALARKAIKANKLG